MGVMEWIADEQLNEIDEVLRDRVIRSSACKGRARFGNGQPNRYAGRLAQSEMMRDEARRGKVG